MTCSRCVLPDNYPGISFDEAGVCNFCRDHKKIEYLGEAKLRQAIASVPRGKGSADCVVPISGGKDSTYVLYYITQVLGLKVVAVNYDNGLMHPQAKENLRRITDSLGIELVMMNGHKQRKYLTGNLKAYLAKPNRGMVPLLCTGCRIGIVGSSCKVARDRGINTIVFGWSVIEDTPFKAEFLKADGGSVMKGLIKNVLSNPRYILYGSPKNQIMDYLHSYSRVRDWGTILQKMHPGIHQISFYDYIEYNPEQIQQIVSEKTGWSAPNPDSSWQFDCEIKMLQNRIYAQEVGFNALNDYLSAKVREGYITREQAMQSITKHKQNADVEFEHIKKLLSEIGGEALIPRLK